MFPPCPCTEFLKCSIHGGKWIMQPDKCHEKQPQQASYAKILRECADIADERQESYGDVVTQFQDTCVIAKTVFNRQYDVCDIAAMMFSSKMSREKNKHKDDNLHDAINYLTIYFHLLLWLQQQKEFSTPPAQ